MDAAKQKEIARKGGRAAHEKGSAHEFTSDEARRAGRKGGERVSINRAHMAEIGRIGGKSSAGRRQSSRIGTPAEAGTGDGQEQGASQPGQGDIESAEGMAHHNPNGG